MASRGGSLLERNVAQLLKLGGLEPELNKIYRGYEIDVFVICKGHKIGFECKQYERSSLDVRNLIHQWDSKNKEIKLDKIVLVIIGCNITSSDCKLAEKYGIILWDEDTFQNLFEEAIDKKAGIEPKLLRKLGISKPLEYVEPVDGNLNNIIEKFIRMAKSKKILKDGRYDQMVTVKIDPKFSRVSLWVTYYEYNGLRLNFTFSSYKNLKSLMPAFNYLLSNFDFEKVDIDTEKFQYAYYKYFLEIGFGEDIGVAAEFLEEVIMYVLGHDKYLIDGLA